MPDLREHFLPRHVLAQVVAEALPVVGRYAILKHAVINSCILSTRIAKLVCDYYEVPSRGVPCEMTLWNRAMIQCVERVGHVPRDHDELMAWVREHGAFARGVGVSDVAKDDSVYPGHVVLRVNDEWIVDMSADQGCDPQHGIWVEPLTFPAKLMDSEDARFWHEETGVGLIYRARPDKPDFTHTPDWSDTMAAAPIVAEIIEELDSLDPQTIIGSSAW